jgi:hypothetical protein
VFPYKSNRIYIKVLFLLVKLPENANSFRTVTQNIVKHFKPVASNEKALPFKAGLNFI